MSVQTEPEPGVGREPDYIAKAFGPPVALGGVRVVMGWDGDDGVDAPDFYTVIVPTRLRPREIFIKLRRDYPIRTGAVYGFGRANSRRQQFGGKDDPCLLSYNAASNRLDQGRAPEFMRIEFDDGNCFTWESARSLNRFDQQLREARVASPETRAAFSAFSFTPAAHDPRTVTRLLRTFSTAEALAHARGVIDLVEDNGIYAEAPGPAPEGVGRVI